MSFKVLATHHTAFTVSDLDRWIAFFRDVLRFPVTPKAKSDRAVSERVTGVPGAVLDIALVTAPGHKIELMQYLEPAGRRRSDLRPCDAGFAHLAFEVDDIEAALSAFAGAGFVAGNPPQKTRFGSLAIYLRHEDGVVFELIQRAGDASDR